MICERPCDTEDWHNGCWKISSSITGIKRDFFKKKNFNVGLGNSQSNYFALPLCCIVVCVRLFYPSFMSMTCFSQEVSEVGVFGGWFVARGQLFTCHMPFSSTDV